MKPITVSAPVIVKLCSPLPLKHFSIKVSRMLISVTLFSTTLSPLTICHNTHPPVHSLLKKVYKQYIFLYKKYK